MTERILDVGTRKYTEVVCLDEPGPGGACHRYQVIHADGDKILKDGSPAFAEVFFQKGPLKENEVNGCHQEDLLAIVLDRLQHFQAGEFKCRENAIAITKIQEAMFWLNHRTNCRQARGVEGTSEK